MTPKPLLKYEELLQLSEELDIAKEEFFIQAARLLDSLEKQGLSKKDLLFLSIQCARIRDLIELEIWLANRAREAGHR